MQASCTPNIKVSTQILRPINFLHLAYQTGGVLHSPPTPTQGGSSSSTLVMTTSLMKTIFYSILAEPQKMSNFLNTGDTTWAVWQNELWFHINMRPILCMNFFFGHFPLQEFFFRAFSLAWIFFWFFPHPPPHHFSNGPSLRSSRGVLFFYRSQ